MTTVVPPIVTVVPDTIEDEDKRVMTDVKKPEERDVTRPGLSVIVMVLVGVTTTTVVV